MKVTEPVSLALLLTASAYSSGISQNNAFLREFNLSAEFSQPPVEKTLYDGGIILYELIYSYAHSAATFIAGHPTSILATLIVIAILLHVTAKNSIGKFVTFFTDTLSTCGSLLIVFALVFLSIESFERGQTDGKRLADIFMRNCYEIKITSEKQTSSGCAFRKDKDSIWYYTNKDFQIFSEPLSDKLKIEYVKPTIRSKEYKPTTPSL